jgi:membrane protease YdiL (CAAX protease family)
MFRQLMQRIGTAESALPWTLWGALAAVLASFAAIIIGVTAVTVLVDERQPGLYLFAWSVALALVIAFVRFTRRQPQQWAGLRLTETNTTASLQNTFWYLLVGIGLAITLDLVGRGLTQQIVPEPELYRLAFYSRYYGEPVGVAGWALALIFMSVLQPIAEGLVFQGLLLPSLRAALGAWPGYILSGVAYGVFHFIAYPPVTTDLTGWWYGLLAPLLGGLIFGAVRLYSGSTRAAILTHAAFGLFAVVKLLTVAG